MLAVAVGAGGILLLQVVDLDLVWPRQVHSVEPDVDMAPLVTLEIKD